jgi:hypothetical protein
MTLFRGTVGNKKCDKKFLGYRCAKEGTHWRILEGNFKIYVNQYHSGRTGSVPGENVSLFSSPKQEHTG